MIYRLDIVIESEWLQQEILELLDEKVGDVTLCKIDEYPDMNMVEVISSLTGL